MLGLIPFETPEWMAELRQAPWAVRMQVLVSAGFGFSGLLFYGASELLHRAARVARVPVRSR